MTTLSRRRFLTILPAALPVALAQGYPYGGEPAPPPPKLSPEEVGRELASLKVMDDALLYVIIRHGQYIREIKDYLRKCLKCGGIIPPAKGEI